MVIYANLRHGGAFDPEFLLSISSVHGHRVMTFTTWHNNRIGLLDSDWPSKQGCSRGNTCSTMGSSTIIVYDLIHILLPVQVVVRSTFPNFFIKRSTSPLASDHRGDTVLEAKIRSKLCELTTLRLGLLHRQQICGQALESPLWQK